ncbi:MAG: hypothetical protein QNJ61_00685 [Desulfobacterales bacterium]|nr:hypothetical protein [Desulfobacterales bacterium]
MDTKIGKGTTFSRTTIYSALRFALDDPFAMRVASNHVLGEGEFEIRIQGFYHTFTQCLVAWAAGIKINT